MRSPIASRWPTAWRSVVGTSCTASAGRPAAGQLVGQEAVQGGVRVDRLLAAAEDDRVAALDAQAGGVDRHVRPRLVDEEDHAERHADLEHLQPVRADAALAHLADRVGQRGHLPQPVGGGRDPGGVSVRRSMAAAFRPNSGAAATSWAFAVSISSVRAMSAVAAASSQRFLASVETRAIRLDAARACSPNRRQSASRLVRESCTMTTR